MTSEREPPAGEDRPEEVADGVGPAPDVPDEFSEAPPRRDEGEPAGPIPGHPNLEPEPPDREMPDEGIVSVEPLDEDDPGAGASEPPPGRP